MIERTIFETCGFLVMLSNFAGRKWFDFRFRGVVIDVSYTEGLMANIVFAVRKDL